MQVAVSLIINASGIKNLICFIFFCNTWQKSDSFIKQNR